MPAYAMSPLEIASGIVMPDWRSPRPLPELPPGMTPRAALERAVLASLRRGRCLVSFSGGRDSSAVLAVATAVARREGLPLPVPVTHRFPAAAQTDESEWQEDVVRHLGLDDWVRLEVADELDALGPVATAAVRRHGVMWPGNAYFHVPIFEAANGGTVLTGIGGDEAFMPSSWSRQLDVLARRVRPRPRDVLRVGVALAPLRVRARVLERRLPEFCTWLRPEAHRRVARRVATDAAREPLRWQERYRQLASSQIHAIALGNLAQLAADADAEAAHPLTDPLFLAALAALPAQRRWRTRTEAMHALVGDLLPETLVRRSTKAAFGEVFWGEQSRAFIAEWAGEGISQEFVDPERLRAVWASPYPDSLTIPLLQSAWLSTRTGVLSGP